MEPIAASCNSVTSSHKQLPNKLRDDNAVPSLYLLQPRSGEWTGTRRWSAEEIALRAIVVGAAERALAGDDPRRHKYSDSATHQEIRHGALTPADAASHVFCYLREFSSGPDPAARGWQIRN